MATTRWSQFTLRRRVNFYETDCAGIVHFSNFFRYQEEAEIALWRAAGMDIAPGDAHVSFPRVSASFDYHRPLRFPDEFDITVRIVAIGRSSLRYECHVVRDDTRVATGTTTVVCVERRPEGLAPVPLPAHILERIEIATA